MAKLPNQKDGAQKISSREALVTITPGLRRYLFATTGICGAAVLIIEILGAKMLAPYVGTSHFVWTAQIAVTLVALASGYAFGGWFADRSSQLRYLYASLLGAALWMCGAAWAIEPVAFACLHFRLALGSLMASMVLFFVPLALLATVGPLCVRRLTSSMETMGRSVGTLSAISTLGSVAGTVLIAYVLIPFLPNSWILYLTAGCLTALGAGYFLIWNRGGKAAAIAAASGVVLLIAAGAKQQPFASIYGVRELYRTNSNFGMIQVLEAGSPRTLRYLANDLLVQNEYDPARHVGAAMFTYAENILTHAYSEDPIRDVLCIGMGAGVTPMRLADEGVRVDVVDINPAMVTVAQRFFDFRPERVRMEIGDGRFFLHESTKQYDAVILDAFLGESSPSHLMTRESFQAVQRRLRPHGIVFINSWGELEKGKDYVPASLHKTLKSVFRSVRMHISPGAAFFVASDQPDLRMWREPDLSAVPEDLRDQTKSAIQSIELPDPADGDLLTDNYNPVDYKDAAYREDLRRLMLHYICGYCVTN